MFTSLQSLTLTATVLLSLAVSVQRAEAAPDTKGSKSSKDTQAVSLEITKERLYEKTKIPARRAFKLNDKINPCEDFHAYVCSNEEKNFKLPSDRSSWTFSFTDHRERLLDAKKQYLRLIQKGAKPKTDAGAQIAETYLACVNEPLVKKEKKEKVAKTLAQVKTVQSNDEWKKIFAANMLNDEYTMVGWDTLANLDEPKKLDAVVYVDALTLPEKRYYTKADVVADYRKILIDFFKSLKFKDAVARAESVLRFEQEMALSDIESNEMRKRYSAKTEISVADFKKKYPHLIIDELASKWPAQVLVRDLVPETSKALGDFYTKYDAQTIGNVYTFRALKDYMDDVDPGFFKKYIAFNHKHLGGPKVRPDRQERCTQLVMSRFPFEFDYELVGILFPEFPKQKVVQVAEKVRGSLLKTLDENKWLTRSARKAAIKKMESARLFLVQPDRLEDWDFRIPKTYTRNSTLENQKLFTEARIEQNLKELKEDRNRQKWAMGPLTTNAYYMPPDNVFVLMMAILQPPFFDAEASEIENIGAIGVVVGHELGHGIDDEGSKFDHEGKLKQWMKDEDLKNFEARTKMFIDQFNGAGHDGKLTLGENIGDHVGLRAAYRAAFEGQEKASADDKKKFFNAYAKAWCGVMTPSARELRLKTDPHALGEARINEQVKHIDGFYDAYACKAGDKMFIAPDQRVKVW